MQSPPDIQAGIRLVGVVRRLLAYIKVKCQGQKGSAAPLSPGEPLSNRLSQLQTPATSLSRLEVR